MIRTRVVEVVRVVLLGTLVSLGMLLGTMAFSAPPSADACLNAMRLSGSKAVKRVAAAERFLNRGKLAKAQSLVEPSDVEFAGAGLQRKADTVFHTVALRNSKRPDWRQKAALQFFTAEHKRAPKDPLITARYAEVLALSDATTAQARTELENLAARDLMPEAQGYATLARLLSKAGEPDQAKAALTACKNMTKQKAVCRLTLAPVKAVAPPRSGHRSRGVLGSMD